MLKVEEIRDKFQRAGFRCTGSDSQYFCSVDLDHKVYAETIRDSGKLFVTIQSEPKKAEQFSLNSKKDTLEFQNPTFVFVTLPGVSEGNLQKIQWKPRANGVLRVEIRAQPINNVAVTFRVYDIPTNERIADFY